MTKSNSENLKPDKESAIEIEFCEEFALDIDWMRDC